MKIYTRTGDKGTTSLVGGERTVKCDPRIEAYGTVDELMAHIGFLHDLMGERGEGAETLMEKMDDLVEILTKLMNAAGLLAAREEVWGNMPGIERGDVEWLERKTDELLAGLPELKSFTLPCGDGLRSYTHICRTVCRRAERRMIAVARGGSGGEGYPVKEEVMAYVNRLSDYFYALGRRLGHDSGAKDITWEGKKVK